MSKKYSEWAIRDIEHAKTFYFSSFDELTKFVTKINNQCDTKEVQKEENQAGDENDLRTLGSLLLEAVYDFNYPSCFHFSSFDELTKFVTKTNISQIKTKYHGSE